MNDVDFARRLMPDELLCKLTELIDVHIKVFEFGVKMKFQVQICINLGLKFKTAESQFMPELNWILN